MLPGWTGCHILTSTVDSEHIHQIGYLPVLNASPTLMSTVFNLMQKSIDILYYLKLSCIVIVVDQALYAKIQDVR